MEQSFYDLLEVSANASREEIEASYQRILSYMGPGALAVYSMIDEAESLRERSALDEAYNTLTDPQRRAAYDRARADSASDYPSVLVPESAAAGEPAASVDVDAIFRAGGSASDSQGEVVGDDFHPTQQSRSGSLGDYEEDNDELPQRAARRAAGPLAGPSLSSADLESTPDELPPAARPESTPAEPPPAARPESIKAEPPPPARAQAPRSSSPEARVISSPPPSAPAEWGARVPVAPSIRALREGASIGGKLRRLQPSQTIDVGPDTEFSGALLRRLRESCPADLETLAEITKISKRYLAQIEAHDFSGLPAAVYVRGFVTEYARVLGLDPQRVAQSYMSLYKRYKGEGT
jgi:curved DNA-binding protein CbpA